MKKYIIILVAILFVSGFGLPCFAVCPTADLTGDCFVGVADLAALATQWLNDCNSPGWCNQTDINHVGLVSFNDFAVLAGQWLTGSQVPLDIVVIRGGTFQMGDNLDGDSSSLPLHTVTLGSFAIGKYPVTNGQYCAFLNAAYPSEIRVPYGLVVYPSFDDTKNYPYCGTSNESAYSQIAFENGIFTVRTKAGRDMSNDPMVWVTWYGAAAYCNWRSRQEGYQTCYNNFVTWTCDFSKHGYRLATEAEWEYAARGGLVGNRFPWGNTISHSLANYQSNSSFSYDLGGPPWGYDPIWSSDEIIPYTSPVGSFAANGYGLYDMVGSVWQWCNDWYGPYSAGSQTNPTGSASGDSHVMRSGGWDNDVSYCRIAARAHGYPDSWYYCKGFRVVLNLN
jgi:formylglycine-generating enzyme required for sulfatase activity